MSRIFQQKARDSAAKKEAMNGLERIEVPEGPLTFTHNRATFFYFASHAEDPGSHTNYLAFFMYPFYTEGHKEYKIKAVHIERPLFTQVGVCK